MLAMRSVYLAQGGSDSFVREISSQKTSRRLLPHLRCPREGNVAWFMRRPEDLDEYYPSIAQTGTFRCFWPGLAAVA